MRFLKLFTEVPIEEIRKMEQLEGAQLNAAKVILADEATKLLHGVECLPQIHATVESLFAGKKGGSAADLDSLPKVLLDKSMVSSSTDVSISVVDLLLKAEMAASKGEARRLIKGGGARVNDKKVADEAAIVSAEDFDAEGRLKLSSGKKTHAVVVLPQ
jgi:tyrosyl-tRNA synthetase